MQNPAPETARDVPSARQRLDVAIVGGGIGGAFLARHLRRALPALRVGLFEKATERSWKVGESTVEISSSYMIRRLGLSQYLYHHQLPKNGLRFFFDDEARSLPIHEMSEIGTQSLPFHPAFQIDRARLERDVLEMNARDGVEVRLGARVESIELAQDGGAHRFDVAQDGQRTAWEARWLVDAAGRASLLARRNGLRVEEPSHEMSSAWARFENVTDVDELGPSEWRARVRHTSRGLSTLHFCYPGYWVWLIPLREGLTSVGVTGERGRFDRAMRTAGGLQAFLMQHRAIAQLLDKARPVDVGSFVQIAYGTKQFFSPARWALVGESAAAQDPLYSPGIDFTSMASDMLVELIRRDVESEAPRDFAERVDLYDRFLRFRHDAAMLLYRDLYPVLGSFEVMRLKWDFDIGSYFDLWVQAFYRDQHLDPDFVRQQLGWQPNLMSVLARFSALFQRIAREKRERGEYFRHNAGRFSLGSAHIDFLEEIGRPRTRRQTLKTLAMLYEGVRQRALDALDVPAGDARRAPLPLSALLGTAPLA